MKHRPRIIALHSSAATGRQWSALAAHVAEFELIAPDLHGHGQAPAWLGPRAGILDADVRLVADLAPAGGGVCHLVGHSYGGAVAIATAVARPDLVASVTVYEPVLFGALPPTSPSRVSVHDVADRVDRAVNHERPDIAAEAFVDFWSGIGSWAHLAKGARAGVASSMRAVAAQFAALSSWRIGATDLADLKAPVLHIAGDRSPSVMREIETVLRPALPNASFRVLPGMGHMAPITSRELVASIIAQHLLECGRENARRMRRAA